MNSAPKPSSPVRKALLVVAVAGAVGITIFLLMLAGWTTRERLSPSEAEARLAATRAAIGDDRPYLAIDGDGVVTVDRSLATDARHDLATLGVLVWEAEAGRLTRVDVPWWFVRVKMSGAIDLGTIVSLAAGDFEHVDLRVGPDDLERRGPGLVLDVSSKRGTRLLLWTE